MIRSEILELRRDLHKHPELSGYESATAKRLESFLNTFYPAKVYANLGGHGLAAVYDFGGDGLTVAIRCELDALPITEQNAFIYKSNFDGVSHKCGHDGHMAIVAGLVFWIKDQNFKKGKVVLLFQPAEETGKGAAMVMEDIRFKNLQIDYIFALHNIPGAPTNQVIIAPATFSAEVQSFSIALIGKESHAAEPEKGINPSYALAEIVNSLRKMNVSDPLQSQYAVLTPVYIKSGQESYGISPGYGEIHYTIRTWSSKTMDFLVNEIKSVVDSICSFHDLEYRESWFEYFPASRNNQECNKLIEDAAHLLDLEMQKREHPFRFGEDFGWFSKDYKTAMFGLGAGVNHPVLHNAHYDFPDEIIESGMELFSTIIGRLLGSNA